MSSRHVESPAETALTPELISLHDRISTSLNDPELNCLATHLHTQVCFGSGNAKFCLIFTDGTGRLQSGDGGEITVSGSGDAWATLLAAPGPPTFTSFTALQLANPSFAVTGDPLKIAQARPALERIFEIVCSAPVAEAADLTLEMGQITGRYLPLQAAGQEFDMYVESSGDGQPLLFLHTAGADSRQFLGQLADVGLAERYRMFAPDLPFHGRTMPSRDYDGRVYQLDSATYRDWIVAMIEQIVREPVILAGCSMGAAMALIIAAEHPELLSGVIAIEPPFRSVGRRNPFQMHVAVHGGLHNSSYVRGLMSPTSPLPDRRRAAWIYAQGAPGIYPGDLAFYSEEFDAAIIAPKIDTAHVPVALLSGSYDYSATPHDGRKVASLLPGSFFREMEGLGHFPMTEHPAGFRPHLLDALDFLQQEAKSNA